MAAPGPSAVARRGKKRAAVDTSAAVPGSEVAAVYRIRPSNTLGHTATPDDDPATASEGEAKAKSSPARKRRAKTNFLEEKRRLKARKREERALLQSAAAAEEPSASSPYVHVKVLCDPIGIVTSLIRSLFPDALTLDVAERMHCAWLQLPSAALAEKVVSRGPVAIAGVPATVAKGRKSPQEVFVSFPGRKVLGEFLRTVFPGVKDVIEAAESCVRARFDSKAHAKAAIKKGTVATSDFPIRAAGEWGTEDNLPTF